MDEMPTLLLIVRATGRWQERFSVDRLVTLQATDQKRELTVNVNVFVPKEVMPLNNSSKKYGPTQ